MKLRCRREPKPRPRRPHLREVARGQGRLPSPLLSVPECAHGDCSVGPRGKQSHSAVGDVEHGKEPPCSPALCNCRPNSCDPDGTSTPPQPSLCTGSLIPGDAELPPRNPHCEKVPLSRQDAVRWSGSVTSIWRAARTQAALPNTPRRKRTCRTFSHSLGKSPEFVIY